MNWQAKVLAAKQQAANMQAQDYHAHILLLERELHARNLLGLKIPYEQHLNAVILDCLFHTGLLKQIWQQQVNIAKSVGLNVAYQGTKDIEVFDPPQAPIDWTLLKTYSGVALKDQIAFHLALESPITKQAVFYALTQPAF